MSGDEYAFFKEYFQNIYKAENSEIETGG